MESYSSLFQVHSFFETFKNLLLFPRSQNARTRERCRESGGAGESKVFRGRLPSGSTGRGQAEEEKAQTKARTTGPRQIQFFQGPQSPTCRQLVRSEVTTQESVASWGGILTISATRRRHATQRLAHRSGGWLGSGSAGGRDLGRLTTVPKMPCGVRHGAYHHARSRGGITGRGA